MPAAIGNDSLDGLRTSVSAQLPTTETLRVQLVDILKITKVSADCVGVGSSETGAWRLYNAY